MCCRCAFASPRYRDRRRPNDRTPCESVPSIPARRAYSCRPASLSMNDRTSRSAACCASVGTFKCRPCFDARVHCGRTGQSRQSEALNRIETYGLRSASVYSFHPMLNQPRGQRARFCPQSIAKSSPSCRTTVPLPNDAAAVSTLASPRPITRSSPDRLPSRPSSHPRSYRR